MTKFTKEELMVLSVALSRYEPGAVRQAGYIGGAKVQAAEQAFYDTLHRKLQEERGKLEAEVNAQIADDLSGYQG